MRRLADRDRACSKCSLSYKKKLGTECEQGRGEPFSSRRRKKNLKGKSSRRSPLELESENKISEKSA